MQILKVLEEYKPIIFGFFGWFFGLISALLSTWLEKKCQRKEFKCAIAVELKEMITRLVGNYLVLAKNSMRANRGSLYWLDSMISAYPGEIGEEGIKAIKVLLKKSEDELAKIAISNDEFKHLFLQKFNLPFLEENIPSLALLNDSSLQASILAVRRNIDWLNENINRNNFHYEKSFDQSLSEENRNKIDANMEQSYMVMADLCRKTADLCKGVILKLDQ